MSVLIAGNGAAGVAALEALREVDREVPVTIVSKNDVAWYSLCALPYYIAGEVEEGSLFRLDEAFYEEKGADLVLGRTVEEVVPAKRKVTLDNGEEMAYSELLIATGSTPARPPIEGIDKDGVCFLGNLDDAKRIRELAGHASRAVVIGAGFTGIECAVALTRLGVRTVVVELLDRVLPTFLDEDMGGEVVDILEARGVRIKLGARVTGIAGGRRAEGVRIDDGEVPCDMVVVAAGVVPNLHAVRGSGLRTRTGILVDEHMRTSDRRIHAAGDVAEFVDPGTGESLLLATWWNAVQQGRVAGCNMAGEERSFRAPSKMNVINVFDVPVAGIGRMASEVEGCEVEVKRVAGVITKSIVLEEKLVGFQSVGDVSRVGPLLSMIATERSISDLRGGLSMGWIPRS
jgi:NAD(P)H-nitrite reductase large subunit